MKESPGQKAMDTAFGQTAQEYTAKGGSASADAHLAALLDTNTKMQEGKDKGLVSDLRSFLGRKLAAAEQTHIPGVSGIAGAARKSIDPEGVNIQNTMEMAMLNNIRTLFPGRVLKTEFDTAMRVGYDPALTPEANGPRVAAQYERLLNQKNLLDKNLQYFQSHGGSLAGMPAAAPVAPQPPKNLFPSAPQAPQAAPSSGLMTPEQWKAAKAAKARK
jgi:hypothetical protein